jgi:tetratricopeptide (TPR) repeat protein
MMRELMPQIPDAALQEFCQSLIVQSEALDELNERWSQTLADYLHVPVSPVGMDYLKLRRKADSRRKRDGPVWLTQATFQQLLADTTAVASTSEEVWLKLKAKLMESYRHLVITDADFGDQQANDLVDLAVGEGNARKAIKLLQKALSYGQTGIQTSKAYLELGNRFADLGDTDQAIACYSQSIEAWRDPLPMAVYWRGELYLQQGRRDEARHDFERVLGLGIWSPEREQAEEYLSQLRDK